MRFRGEDELLAMEVVDPEDDLLVVTEGGYAKRTPLSEYRVQGRGGLGVKVADLDPERGALVGALVTDPDEEIMAVMESGKVIRVSVADVRPTGRATKGVILTRTDEDDKVLAITRTGDPQVGSDQNGSDEENSDD